MTSLFQDALIETLSDGQFHSGVQLGRNLQISRTAVWKHLQKLEEIGLQVEKIKGKGYRIPGGLDLLSANKIGDHLPLLVKLRLADLQVHGSIGSTNSWVLQRLKADRVHGCIVCLAEFQSAGRGRRGRSWFSPFGQNIYLSVGRQFYEGLAGLEGLSLAVGVIVVEGLKAYGLDGLQLKWPNDVWLNGKKLAGILIELSGEQGGPCHVVIGLGLNVYMEPSVNTQVITQAWTSLRAETRKVVDRNELAAQLSAALIQGLDEFEKFGFAAFKARWERYNALLGQDIQVSGAIEKVGVCRGVSASGHLLLEVSGSLEEIGAGEVSLRPA